LTVTRGLDWTIQDDICNLVLNLARSVDLKLDLIMEMIGGVMASLGVSGWLHFIEDDADFYSIHALTSIRHISFAMSMPLKISMSTFAKWRRHY